MHYLRFLYKVLASTLLVVLLVYFGLLILDGYK